jgi:prepilin-type N-terminal cleavage/methylation domain-containing protein
VRPSGERGVTLTELAVAMAIFGVVMAAVLLAWSAAQQAYFVGAEAAEHQQNLRAAIDFMVRELRATGRDATGCAFDYQGPGSRDCTRARVDHCRVSRNLGSLGYTANGCQGVFAMPFAEITETSFQIRSDRNDSGTVARTANASAADEGAENVRYGLATGAQCPRGVKACLTRDDGAGAVAMVAVDIAGVKFTYHPRSGFPPCDAEPPRQPCPAFGLPLGSQEQADNIGRIGIEVTSRTTTGGRTITRRFETDVVLRNR